MTDNRLLDLVDGCDFRTLFIDELGWNNPDRPDVTFDIDGETYTLNQVAGYKGLRIWRCPVLPPRKIQRMLDVLIGKDNHERLVIFTAQHKQEWRWPRRAQLGSANAKLMVHEHLVGDRSTHLVQRLRAIELDFDSDISLVELLNRMRDAFDTEAEDASTAAARLMGTLYANLEKVGVGEHEATLLLTRLLFLLFGDAADMWKPAGLFKQYLHEHTTAESLHNDLLGLFKVLNTDERNRTLPADSPYAQFRYINGGLFHDSLRLPALSNAFRDSLIEACEFDWSIISPAVFGSMFQTVKDKEARRAGGEHYTTESNILKTIRPLFLDELHDRLDRAWNDKAQLTKLHNDLGRGRYLDPACGCGNFLVVAYRELRSLELELLKRRRDLDMAHAASKKVERAQLSLDVTGEIKVTLDHFYGIEIDEWPARIAETAMLLVDHLANQQMAVEFGFAPDRLPVEISAVIRRRSALEFDWRELLSSSEDTVVFGNPPFAGQKERTSEQADELRRVWGSSYNGNLDYVSAWFRKASTFLTAAGSRFAFVATSSICQGQSVSPMWEPILAEEWKISFAHRPFEWDSEAKDAAGVHVVIVGMSKKDAPPSRRLFEYADNGKGKPREVSASNINPYLVDGPDITVRASMRPISAHLPRMTEGSKLWDFGFLVLKPADIEEFRADEIAARHIRPLLSNTTMLKGQQRWVLWLKDSSDSELQASALIRDRIASVRLKRLGSSDPEANKKATTPHLFTNDRQPGGPYLAIPKVTGHSRNYLPVAYSSENVIVNNTLFTALDEDGFIFSVVSSRVFTIWQRLAGGHTRADSNFSNTLVWNTFPLTSVSGEDRKRAIEVGQEILRVRSKYPKKSLENLYGTAMPTDLLEAHRELDRVIEYCLDIGAHDIAACQVSLLNKYAQMMRS